MLVRTRARTRVQAEEPQPRRVFFRPSDEVVFGGPRFSLPDFGLSGMELDWGHDGIRKTMRVREGWVLGTFEYDLRGRSLLALPIFYPLAAIFLRLETRRFAGWAKEDWTSHPDDENGPWQAYPDIPPDDDEGSGVREPRQPHPPAGGATIEHAPPDVPDATELTAEARAAVRLAEDEARRLGHTFVSDGHLLLGLLRERSGVAAEALAAAGVTLDEARRRLADVIPRDRARLTGRLPRTPRVTRLLAALASASAEGASRSGTGEILAALLADAESVAVFVVVPIAGSVDAVLRELAAIGARGER